MAKKRNKKYNPIKNKQLIAERDTRNLCMVFVSDVSEEVPLSYVVDYRTGNRLFTTKRLLDKFMEVPHQWCVHIAVMGVDSNEQAYMKSEVQAFKVPYYHADLRPYLNEKHDELIERFNLNHFTHVAFIASPVDREFDLDHVKMIYTKNGWTNETK